METSILEKKAVKESRVKVKSHLYDEVLYIPQSVYKRAQIKDASVAGFEGDGFYVSGGFDFYSSKHLFDGHFCGD